MNSVRYILDNRPLSQADRVKIKALGRPLPDLQMKICQVGKSRDFIRYFKRETTYDRFQWMCGCPETNKLYCFVCLVGGYDTTSQFTSTGVSDLQHLRDRGTKHANSAAHLNHVVDFNLLGAADLQKQLSSNYLKAVADHNQKVDRNRQTLRRLIMCLKFSGAVGLPLHKCDFQGQEVFHGLLDFVAKWDHSWDYLSETIVLQKDSKLLRNELLDAILQVCKSEIVHQVREASFVALIVERSEDCKLIIILRYFLKGQIFERFWDVVQMDKFTVEDITKVLLKELEALELDTSQLIAQSSNIPSCIFRHVKAAIRESYPNAFLVHNYSHHFKVLLENAAFRNKRMNLFFAIVEGFERFFSQSPQRIAVLDEVAQTKLPWIGNRTWNFETGTLKELYGRTDVFRECLYKIIEDFKDTDTLSAASSLLSVLDNKDIDYFLQVVYSIVQHVELFFDKVSSEGIDGRLVREHLKELEARISELDPHLFVAPDDVFDEEKEPEVKQHELTDEGRSPAASKRRRVETNEVFEPCYVKIEVDELLSLQITADEVSQSSEIETRVKDEKMDVFKHDSTHPDELYEPSEIKMEIKDEELRETEATTSTYKLYCPEGDEMQELKLATTEYCTSLINELKDQYSFTGYISAAALFCPDKFPTYKIVFPESVFEETVKAYPFIDKAKLKMELTVLYGRKDISCSGLLLLLVFIHKNGLQEGFSETYKLLDIVCTTPMATREAERCFTTLKMVKNFVTNAESDEGLRALAMLSVEKSMVQSILNFDDKVINVFAESQNRDDFKYM